MTHTTDQMAQHYEHGQDYAPCTVCRARTASLTRQPAYVPVWRRRQLAELAENGGRIIARSVTAGGRSVAL